MDIELIINKADPESLDRLRQITGELRRQGHRVHARITFESGDATRFAREAVARDVDLVICAGGDGTVNKVVNGLLPRPGTPFPSTLPRLGIVPLGTGNDFAGFFEIPDDVEEAIAVALDGPELLIDVPVLNGRYFVNVSSGGLAAAATVDTPARAKRFLGSAAYIFTGAKTLAELDVSQGRFSADEELLFDGRFLFFAVGNGGRAGGGTWITPRADPADGLLDLCIVREMSRTELLRLLPELRSGDHLQNEQVVYHRVSSLSVQPVGELCVNIDGESVEGSILNYSVVPRALRLSAYSRR